MEWSTFSRLICWSLTWCWPVDDKNHKIGQDMPAWYGLAQRGMDGGIQDPEFNNSVLKISSPSLCEFNFIVSVDTYLPWCRVTEEEMSTLSEEDRQHEISKYLILEFPWVINYAERQIDTTHSKRPQGLNFKASSFTYDQDLRSNGWTFFPVFSLAAAAEQRLSRGIAAKTVWWLCRVYSNAFESPVTPIPVERCWRETEGGWD